MHHKKQMTVYAKFNSKTDQKSNPRVQNIPRFLLSIHMKVLKFFWKTEKSSVIYYHKHVLIQISHTVFNHFWILKRFTSNQCVTRSLVP